MTFDNPVFAAYVTVATLMILKLMGQGWITVYRMMKVGGGFLNPEDEAGGLANPKPRPGQLDADDYVALLQHNDQEIETLFREILIGVTRFFRDKPAFDLLEKQTIPALFSNRTPDKPLRIWVCGCATGEEAYSIALLLRRHMDQRNLPLQVQIFATDIDPEAIETLVSWLYR